MAIGHGKPVGRVQAFYLPAVNQPFSNATLTVTEADDVLVATATVLVGATLTVTEADDTLSSTATVLVSASLTVTEANDTLVATATVGVGASLAVTEANDTITATSTVLVGASLTVTEANDTLSSTATVLVGASLTVTEADDTLSAVASSTVAAALTVTEANDTLLATATVGSLSPITATLTVTEADDLLSAQAFATQPVVFQGRGGGGGIIFDRGQPSREMQKFMARSQNAPSSFTPLASSNVSGYSYDAGSQTLQIAFASGKTYSYKGVPQDVADGLSTAESPGKYFNNSIKGTYDQG